MDGLNDAVVMISALILSRKVDYTNPDTVMKIRVLYFLLEAIVLGVYGYIYTLIKKKADKVEVKTKDMKGVETTQTVEDYDIGQLRSAVMGSMFSIAMTMVFQIYMKSYYQMVFRLIMTPFNLWKNNLFRIHLRNHEATDKLARPWKKANPLESLTGMFKPDEQVQEAQEEVEVEEEVEEEVEVEESEEEDVEPKKDK